MENKKLSKFEVESEKFLCDTVTFNSVQNVMKQFKINDDTIAHAISLTLKDTNENEVNKFLCNVEAEKEILQNDLSILENTSEIFLNRE
jgi:hypothetical protein